MVVVLLWHRLEWGFEEWIHEVTFFNFWNGTYVIISGSKLYTYIIKSVKNNLIFCNDKSCFSHGFDVSFGVLCHQKKINLWLAFGTFLAVKNISFVLFFLLYCESID
jgi:hypothetical protein